MNDDLLTALAMQLHQGILEERNLSVPPHATPPRVIKNLWVQFPNRCREVNFYRFQDDYHGRESGFDFTSYIKNDLTTLIRAR